VTGAPPRDGFAPLGITYEICVPPPDMDEKKAWGALQRVKRYAILAVARRVLSDKKINKKGEIVPEFRVFWCRKYLAWGKDEIKIRVMSDHSKAFLGNVAICGSVHVCPVDAYTIGRKRGQELREATEKKGCGQAFLVNTLQHKRETSLDQLYQDLAGGISFMLSGAPAARFREKWEIKGIVSGWDYTCSLHNGHHPHKNLLFLSALPSLDCQEFRDDLYKLAERYLGFVEKRGYYTNQHTVKALTNKDDCAEYMTKWALSLEVSSTASKEGKAGHFTQFQLLYEIGFGDLDEETRQGYINLFREFAEASKGKRQLYYSHGLRSWLGLGQDKTDEELAQEGSEPHFDFAGLSYEQYRPILAAEKSGSIGRMLEAAREFAVINNLPGFWAWLESEFGIVPDMKNLSTRPNMPL